MMIHEPIRIFFIFLYFFNLENNNIKRIAFGIIITEAMIKSPSIASQKSATLRMRISAIQYRQKKDP